MRILFLTHRLPYPPNKGEKIHTLWELRTLAREHAVDLFCFYDDPADVQHVDALRQLCREVYAEPLSYFRSRANALLALARGIPFSLGYFYSPKLAARVRQAIASRGYDLLFIYSSSMAQYVEAQRTMPRVIDMADVDSAKWQDYAARSAAAISWLWSLEAKRLGAYEARIAREFLVTILGTEAEAEMLRGMAPGATVEVLPHGLDGTYFDPQAVPITDEVASWRPYVIFSGSMDYRPNVDAVLHFYQDIFPLIRRENPDVRFVIAGRNPAPAVQKLAADAAVKVTGAVPDIRVYLRGAAAAVLPLRIARGFQNKLLEALAMGIPVVTSTGATTGLPRAVNDLLSVDDDPQGFAAKTLDLLRHGPKCPPEMLRSVTLSHFDDANLQRKLQGIITSAVQGKEAVSGR